MQTSLHYNMMLNFFLNAAYNSPAGIYGASCSRITSLCRNQLE